MGKRMTNRPRGSVLIFAIVLLSILAMLGSAFLLMVRQSTKASVSIMSNSQADNSAKSGLEHAIRVLRSNVLRYTICSDTAVFSMNPPSGAVAMSPFAITPANDAFVTTYTASEVSPLMQFRGFDNTNPRAILSLSGYDLSQAAFNDSDIWNYSGPHYTSEILGAVHIPTGTQMPALLNAGSQWVQPNSMFHIYVGEELVIDTAPNDETVVVTDISANQFQANFSKAHLIGPVQVGILEFARRNNVVANSVGDFFVPTLDPNKVKQMFPLSTSQPRGEYYVWIADEDAKFYAVLNDWSINNDHTEYSPTASIIQQGVLISLGVFSTDDIADLNNLPWQRGTDPTNDSRFPAARSNTELALQLTSTKNSAPGDAYKVARNALDTYITPYKDTADYALLGSPKNLQFCFCKDWGSAININTAPVEIIAAALSQIPSENRNDFGGATLPGILALGQNIPVPGGKSLAWYLAQRIVEKRPFLCRMDFEDFLAAQIMGTAGFFGNSYDNGAINLTAIPDDLVGGTPNPIWVNDPSYWNDPANPPPIADVLYFLICRRLGPGNTTFSIAPNPTDSTYQTYQWFQANLPNIFNTPELTLSQYLELAGVPDNPPPNNLTSLSLIAGVAVTPNMPAFQKARFRFFFGTPTERNRLVNQEHSLITFKEFNNIINSVTTIFVNDDQQVAFPCTKVGKGAKVVAMGTDGSGHPKMNTIPQGDDQYDNPKNPTMIITNPVGDGIAKTWVSSNRPSWYSYFNDAAYMDNLYTQIDAALTEAAKTSNDPNFYKAKSLLDPAVSGIPVAGPPASTIGNLIANTANRSGLIFDCKMCYLFRLDGQGVPPPPTPATPPARLPMELTDLLFCRCRPNNSALTQGLAGCYQMSFDDWTPFSTNLGESLGIAQTCGDPTDIYNTYSSANPISVGGLTASGQFQNGDVNWSPQFAFRSRFYGIYVLGHGLLQGAGQPRDLGQRRLEAVYDALKDEVLWQRSQLSDKRSLGD